MDTSISGVRFVSLNRTSVMAGPARARAAPVSSEPFGTWSGVVRRQPVPDTGVGTAIGTFVAFHAA